MANVRGNRRSRIQNDKRAWSYIKHINFPPLEEAVLRDHPEWSRALVHTAVSSYQMFLYIARVYPGWSCAPHRAMDMIWHQHILFTKRYADDCQAIFGKFLHHNPANPPSKRSKKESSTLDKQYMNTRRQMILIFGQEADPETLFKPFARELHGKHSKRA